MKKPKIKSDKPTIKQLDDLCRKVVRARDEMTCRRCGRKPPYKMEVAHFISRSNRAVRWDLDNVRLLCFNCHYNFAHKDPAGWTQWVRDDMGENEFDKLRMRANGKCGDLWGWEIYLKQELKKYEQTP